MAKQFIRIITVIILSFIVNTVFCQAAEYKNGNGTVIDIHKEGNFHVTIRNHVQSIDVSDETDAGSLDVYDRPDKIDGNFLFYLQPGKPVKSLQVLTKEGDKGDLYITWLKIETPEKKTGWIYIGTKNPYRNDNWSFLPSVKTAGRTWTVRKLEESLFVEEVVNVRDKPGLNGSVVLFTLVPDKTTYQKEFETIALTEETDTVEGITDHWIKIIDKTGRTGWLFGGNAVTERGGPKYFTPENIIASPFLLP